MCHVEAPSVDYTSRFKVYTESWCRQLLGLCKFILCDLLCAQQQTESLRAERRLYMETMASDALTEVETQIHAQKQKPAFLLFKKKNCLEGWQILQHYVNNMISVPCVLWLALQIGWSVATLQLSCLANNDRPFDPPPGDMCFYISFNSKKKSWQLNVIENFMLLLEIFHRVMMEHGEKRSVGRTSKINEHAIRN